MPAEPASMLVLAGQALFGGAFIFAAARNMANVAVLTQVMAGRGVPFTQPLLFAGIALQLVAGILLFVGAWTPFAAAALVLFLLVATPMFHNFWDHDGVERANRINGVVANVALAGGLLVMMAGAA